MRADRLLSLMLLLRARGRMTAQDAARHLEVSERTVYRDIDALSAAGVPIYTQPGTNGGIFLDENYRISLTGLTRPEVMSLFVSSGIGPLDDIGLSRAVEDTLLKLFAALPSVHRQEVERMRQRLYIDPADWFQLVEPTPFLHTLQQAVWEDRIVGADYERALGQFVDCMLEPYALVAKANTWYLVGNRVGGGMRTFRVSRFRDVRLTDDRFERVSGFDLEAFWKASCRDYEEDMRQIFPPYPAKVRVHPDVLWLVFDGLVARQFNQVGPPDPQGWITLDVVFASMEDAVMRALGLGTYIDVLEPDELREWVVEVARTIVDYHETKQTLKRALP